MQLRCADRLLDLSNPVVMGVLNVTPDSFSDGGRFDGIDRAVDHAAQMLADGAQIIDVGGESTRPGAAAVDPEDELQRVIPVVEALARRFDSIISVDTMKPEVMRAAAGAGARFINDVNALRADGALQAVADSGLACCLMHMQGAPRTMQQNPHYADVVGEVREFLRQRVLAAQAAGIELERICVDPGIGFGKSLDHNLQLLANLNSGLDMGMEMQPPLLIGVSRKSMFDKLLGRPVERRLPAGLAVAALAVWQGASVIRTHDVRETIDAIRTTAALRSARGEAS